MGRLADGFLTTQLLYVAARLGVADVLAEGPRTGAELAAAVGAEPDLLTRALRGLGLEEVLAEEEGGRFTLTELGQCLRAHAPRSMRGPVLARGEVYYQAAAGALAAVRHGGTAFEHVHGDRFFDHLRRHPEREAAFQASMTARSEQEAGDVVAAYDFGRIGRLVDVGGGHGILLGAILRSAPDLHAVLVDQPAVVEEARRRLTADGVADRCRLVPGDFFTEVPAGADAYMLSRVLHTTGPTTTPAGCWPPAAPPWAREAGSSSSRRSCPNGPPTSRPSSGWTCTCWSSSAPASAPRPSSAASWPAPASRSAAWSRRARWPASA
jgi:hypothetical protein